MYSLALKFHKYKTFVVFKSVTFEKNFNSWKVLGMMPIVFSMKIRNVSKVTLLKVTQFLSLSKVSLFEIFGKCSESVNFDVINDLQEDLKTTKVLYL